jgi:general secretion pathway protein M
MYTMVASPLLNLYADNAERIATRRALVAKLHRVSQELPALSARVAQLRSAASSQSVTLEGGSDAIALATLQGRIEELASAAGVTIGSTESIPAEAQGPYRRLGLRLVLSGPYNAVIRLLASLEKTNPPLIVDNLQIHAIQRRPGTPMADSLDTNIEIYAYRTGDKAGEVAKR